MTEPAILPATPASAADPLTLVNDRLYRLGGQVELDERVSWVPPGTQGWLPANCYAVVEGDEVLLIDTGLACHEASVLGALDQLVEPGKKVKVFITRSEMDCVSNLGAIASRFGVE